MILIQINGMHCTACVETIQGAISDVNNADDIKIIAGGIIPNEEIPKWNKLGIEAIFGPGSSTTEIIDYINRTTN